MGIIFSASSDRYSFEHSSRLIGPVLRWLFPHVSERVVHTTIIAARKVAHLSEYAVLAWLVWRAFRVRHGRGPAPWSWSEAGWTLLLVFLYSASDEFHQRFVPSREASLLDVLIDTSGGALGLLVIFLFRSIRFSNKP